MRLYVCTLLSGMKACVRTFWISSGDSFGTLRICCASCRLIPEMLEAAADCWPPRPLASAAAWLAEAWNRNWAKNSETYHRDWKFYQWALKAIWDTSALCSLTVPANSCRSARANARPTTCAPTTMIWARYFAWIRTRESGWRDKWHRGDGVGVERQGAQARRGNYGRQLHIHLGKHLVHADLKSHTFNC